MTAVAILQSQLLSIKSECELHYFWIIFVNPVNLLDPSDSE